MDNPASRVMWSPFARYAADTGKKQPWPRKPWPAPQRAKPPAHGVAPIDARQRLAKTARGGKVERRSHIEVLSRLAGGTTYRTPDGLGAQRGRGMGVDDLAHALGFVRDPLDQRLALAFACGTDAEWAAVQELAAPLLLKQLLGSPSARTLVLGAKKYRARLVLHDAFHDLVLARAPHSVKEAADRVRMSVRDYRLLYKGAAGFLETRAQEGARVACCALFGTE